MERKEILRRVDTLDSHISLLRSTLQTIKETNFFTFPVIYVKFSFEGAILSEKIACDFRNLVYATTAVTKGELMEKIAEIHKIDFYYDDEIFKITLPSLLPKKEQRKNSDFIFDPLHSAFEKYFAEHHCEKFTECAVCFTHVYSKETPGRRFRDHDNFELKQVLDVISLFLMKDDSGRYCDTYNSSRQGKNDYTYVEVMSKNRFKKWVSER